MDLERARERVHELRREIRRHDELYYVADRPAISDAAYDELLAELRGLEDRHPELITPDSPTRRVPGRVLEGFASVRHVVPMRSLESSRERAALERFHDRVSRAVPGVRYVLEPKLDGLSVELVYEDGALVRAATRGDGVHGEGVTDNVRTIRAVPLALSKAHRAAPRLLAVRGEVLMRVAAFTSLNEALLNDGQASFANPRNAAAGSLRQLDPRVTAARPLDAFAYELLAVDGARFESHRDVLTALAEWGLRTPQPVELAEDLEAVLAYHRSLGERRDALGWEIDGIVVKVDDLGARAEIGETSHHPRWAFALKYEPRHEVTRVLSIMPSVGRSGVVTPFAMLEPVEVGGVTISTASLHNREEVARRDVRAGDRVRVQRAGDVIPQVVEVVHGAGQRGERFRMPERCPSCGAGLVERGPRTFCPNSFDCPAQQAGRLEHFGSRDALDIASLGEETARALVRSGLALTPADLFDLDADAVAALPGFAAASANKLIAAIEAARHTELRRLLYGLGIPGVGTTAARALAAHFGSLESLRAAGPEELRRVAGIGPRMAADIRAFLDEPHVAAVLDALESRLEMATAANPDGALSGLAVVITGRLERFSRHEAEELIARHGGRVQSAVGRSTDLVVVGADPGSKLSVARRLGVRTVDEPTLLELVGEG